MAGEFREAGEVRCDPAMARVYEHGWQSWSPTGVYPALATSPRPRRPLWQTTGHRPERPAPPSGFQGEGLLAVEVDGHARVWSAPDPHREVPSIRARPEAGRIVVEADGDLDEHESASGLDDALRAWADAVAERLDVRLEPAIGPMWCSWYCYWQHVTAADIEANLDAIDRHELPVGIIQIDDGHQAGIGDWLDRSPGFPDLPGLAARIRGSGRLPGIWTAPLLVGEDSRLAAEQPGWLAGDASGGRNWDQELAILDVTHPGAAEYLTGVFRSFAEMGFGFFKIDFMYAGAIPGRRHADASPLDAYGEALRIIRDGIGEESLLLGCGAPMLPSIGRVDVMRVSPDVHTHYEPLDGDISQPSIRAAVAAGQARSFQHGRLWINDPDCLIVRPEVERREDWAAHIEASGGLATSSDPIDELDEWGLETTRRLLRPSVAKPVDQR